MDDYILTEGAVGKQVPRVVILYFTLRRRCATTAFAPREPG